MAHQTKETRSRIMASVRSSGNKSTEAAFISILKGNSITGWRRKYPAYGKPDFVFLPTHVAIFIDGCFWHKCANHCRLPSSNVEYWVSKIENNVKRDRNVSRHLREMGWTVIRFWEHELKGDRAFSQKLAHLKRLIRVQSGEARKRKRKLRGDT